MQVNLVKRWLDDALRVETEQPLPPDRWHHVLLTYDGSRVAAASRSTSMASPRSCSVLLDDLNQTFQTKEPLRIGGRRRPGSRFRGASPTCASTPAALSPAEDAGMLAVPRTIDDASPSRRPAHAGQARKLRACFLEHTRPADIRAGAPRSRLDLRQKRQALCESFPTTMVMEEMPTPRDASS